MAEAHHATHYSASLSHEHHKVKARTSWTRWMTKCHNQILNWIYPAHLEGIVLVTGIVTSLYFGERWFAVRVIDGVVKKLPEWVFLYLRFSFLLNFLNILTKFSAQHFHGNFSHARRPVSLAGSLFVFRWRWLLNICYPIKVTCSKDVVKESALRQKSGVLYCDVRFKN